MNDNATLDHTSLSQEEKPQVDFIQDLFWEGPFGEADCAGL